MTKRSKEQQRNSESTWKKWDGSNPPPSGYGHGADHRREKLAEKGVINELQKYFGKFYHSLKWKKSTKRLPITSCLRALANNPSDVSGFSSDTEQGGRFGVSGFFNQAASRVGLIVKAAKMQAKKSKGGKAKESKSSSSSSSDSESDDTDSSSSSDNKKKKKEKEKKKDGDDEPILPVAKAATGGYQSKSGAELLKKLTNQSKPTASASSGGTPPFSNPKDAIEYLYKASFGQAPARDSDTFANDYEELLWQLTEDAGVSCQTLNAFLKELEVGGKRFEGTAPETAEKSLVSILQSIVRE